MYALEVFEVGYRSLYSGCEPKMSNLHKLVQMGYQEEMADMALSNAGYVRLYSDFLPCSLLLLFYLLSSCHLVLFLSVLCC
jgi:hypothetical protein